MQNNETKPFDKITEQYEKLVNRQSGKAIRPYRLRKLFNSDGYINMITKYGTSKDTSEHYRYEREEDVIDSELTAFYEGNGLFAKIIDTPAEEAVKHGFSLEGISDSKTETFCSEALDELDWEETAMTAIKWARLFGGALVVMLINDGGRLEDPVNWKRIRSIDDLRIYDRSLVEPEYSSMYSYEADDPFGTRGSRLGMPERYRVYSKYGTFTVHDSRCLVFQNGILPENTTNTTYELWGMPEYLRIHRAIRDAEIAHGSATKMLEKSVQPVYKVKNLAQLLATEEGEELVIKRLQVIDLARSYLNSIAIDSDGEEYDFRQFNFSGVSDVIDATCNYLSSLTSIPQTILFGRSPAGMNATGESDLENYYNYVERIQKKMLKSNLRYLLSVVLQAGLYTGEIDELPPIRVKFNPLWSMSEGEQADLEQKKAQVQLTKAQTATTYVDMQALDPSEVRRKLAESDEFDVENILDGYETEDDLFEGVDDTSETGDETESGNSPDAAPEATKLPQDMNPDNLEANKNNSENTDSALDKQNGKGIINENISFNVDGAPEGNQNAAGPHKKGGTAKGRVIHKAEREKLSRRLVGKTSSRGVTVTEVHPHAFDRLGERLMSPRRVEMMLASEDVKPDKTHPDRMVYDIPGSRLVLSDSGVIVSVMWRKNNK